VPGHLHWIFDGGLPLRAGMHIAAMIEHDSWCGIYYGAACNCVSNITATRCPYGEVVVIDESRPPRKQ
jgi:hypothetical protein